MTRAPAYQFYPADYLADARVQAMSIEGEGCYSRLMAYCWHEGSLPNDRAALAKLCKGYDGPGLDEAISCFVKSKNKNKLRHKRLSIELRKQKRHRKALSAAGLRGAEGRWPAHGQAIPGPMASDGSSSSSSSSSSKSKNPSISPFQPKKEYVPSDIAVEEHWRRVGARGNKQKDKEDK
jgi:uncharacterized protein YdaU (DUF1376 family)